MLMAAESVPSGLTLAKLRPNALDLDGGKTITFGTDEKWALVLPQDTVGVTVTDTQSAG